MSFLKNAFFVDSIIFHTLIQIWASNTLICLETVEYSTFNDMSGTTINDVLQIFPNVVNSGIMWNRFHPNLPFTNMVKK